MKYWMLLFYFSPILMKESYWTICGMWSIGKINLDRRETQMFSVFDFFILKMFLVTTLCCRRQLCGPRTELPLVLFGVSVGISRCRWSSGREDMSVQDLQLEQPCHATRLAAKRCSLITPARTKSTGGKHGCAETWTGATTSGNGLFLVWTMTNLEVDNNSWNSIKNKCKRIRS